MAHLSLLAESTGLLASIWAFYTDLPDLLRAFIQAGVMILVVMSMAGYAVLAERKICSYIHGRHGPNRTVLPILGAIPVIGPLVQKLGLCQPMADGGKFLFKEEPVPGHVKKFYYVLAPCLSVIPALTTMTVLPFGTYADSAGALHPLVLANVDVGLLFILAISSLGVYGIILAGWASNSKYPFLGGVRASAQLISYELAMGMSLLPVFMWAAVPGAKDSGVNLFQIVEAQKGIGNSFGLWIGVWQPLSALIFLVALFAEANRLPFDMAESETDLVAGFNTEYGAFKFGLFFVAEYTHMIVGSAVFVCLFLGGWHLPFLDYNDFHPLVAGIISISVFLAKVLALIFLFIQVRWTLPRFRYDQVMTLGWKKLLPLAVFNLFLNAIIIALIEHKP